MNSADVDKAAKKITYKYLYDTYAILQVVHIRVAPNHNIDIDLSQYRLPIAQYNLIYKYRT